MFVGDFSDNAIKTGRFSGELTGFCQNEDVPLYDLKDFCFDDIMPKSSDTLKLTNQDLEKKLKLFIDNVTLLIFFPTKTKQSKEQHDRISELIEALPYGAVLKPAGNQSTELVRPKTVKEKAKGEYHQRRDPDDPYRRVSKDYFDKHSDMD